MDTSTQIEEYLEQLIQFKQIRELHSDYLEVEQLNKLLKELTLELGFNEDLWQQSREQALHSFIVFNTIEDDYNLSSENERIHTEMCIHFLMKAINLDPFNKKFLEAYITEGVNKWPVEKFRKIQYLQLFKPTSTETTALQVDLGLGQEDLNYDYFSDEVIGPFVNELVFLEEKTARESEYASEETLNDLAKQAGIDADTMKDIKNELEEMYILVDKTFDDHWLDWKKIHKALITAEKMVDLAPYDPKILETAIRFYGKTFWRSLLGAARISDKAEGYAEFCQFYFNKKRPNKKDKTQAADRSMEIAHSLTERYMALPKSAFKEQSEHEHLLEMLKAGNFRMFGRKEASPDQINAFTHAQSIMFQFYRSNFIFKIKNTTFGLIVGAILYVAAAIFSAVVLGNVHFLWTYIAVPGLMALGVAEIRRRWWKRTQIKINYD